jgi:hypothetical protein
MHVYTLVITPGPRRSAVARAETLLAEAAPSYCDYCRAGGWFTDRFGAPDRPEIIAWHEEEAKRRKLFEAENPIGHEDLDYDLRELVWSSREDGHRQRLRRLEAAALVDLTRLTSGLPSPLPESMIPAALVDPGGRWRMRPATWDDGDPRWVDWVNAAVDRHRGGHCAVVADCHL